jgi:hypothetical protein
MISKVFSRVSQLPGGFERWPLRHRCFPMSSLQGKRSILGCGQTACLTSILLTSPEWSHFMTNELITELEKLFQDYGVPARGRGRRFPEPL